MRRLWNRHSLWTFALLGLIGCTSTDPLVTPPKHPDEYNVPPDDSRYSRPPEYPKQVMKQGLPRKPGMGVPGAPGAMGAPGGMSGPMPGSGTYQGPSKY